MNQVYWEQVFFSCWIHIKTYPLLPCLIYTLTCKAEPSGSQFFLCCPSYSQTPAIHANLSRDLFEILGQDGSVRTHLISKIHGPYSVVGVDSGLDWGISEIPLKGDLLLWVWKLGVRVQCGEQDTHIMEYFFSGLTLGIFSLPSGVYHA